MWQRKPEQRSWTRTEIVSTRVVDLHWFNADPDTVPDPAFFITADPNTGFWWPKMKKFTAGNNLSLGLPKGRPSYRRRPSKEHPALQTQSADKFWKEKWKLPVQLTYTGGKPAKQQKRDQRLLDGSPQHLQMCQLYLYLGSSTRVIMYHVCTLL